MFKEAIPEAEDLLPEHCTYRDEGCDLFPACLDCPLPRCAKEMHLGARRAATLLRNREIIRQYRLGGKKAKDLASQFHISLRSVQRLLRAERRTRHD